MQAQLLFVLGRRNTQEKDEYYENLKLEAFRDFLKFV